MRVWAENGMNLACSSRHVAAADAVLLLGQHHDRAALRRLVGQRGELRRIGQLLLADAAQRQELGRLAVAERDGAGLVEQQRVDVARRLDRAARHGEHVEAHQPVHAGDADGREQRADGGRDQGDEQRHQHDDRDRCRRHRRRSSGWWPTANTKMIVMPASRMLSAISFGVFCRSAPSTSAIMRSRKVEPGRGGDAHLDPVGEHLRAAGDGRAVAAGLADDRRGFAGDRRLVDRGDALDHLAVGGIRSPASTSTTSPALRLGRRHELVVLACRRGRAAWPRSRCACSRSASACALPRPSATASAKLANSTVNQSQRMIWNEKPRLPPPVDEVADEQDRGQQRHHLDHEHHRVLDHDARVELGEAPSRAPARGSPGRTARTPASACDAGGFHGS